MRAYTDSSYNERTGIAGIGCVIVDGAKVRVYSNYVKCASNNIGELYAIWFASNICKDKDVTVYTDSQYAIGFIKGEVKDKPLTQKQYENRQLSKLIAYKIKRFANVDVNHIKAHTNFYQENSIYNSMADLLAKKGVADYLQTQKTLSTKNSRNGR